MNKLAINKPQVPFCLKALLLSLGVGIGIGMGMGMTVIASAQSVDVAAAIPVSTQALSELVIYPQSRISASVLSLRHAEISVEARGRVKQVFAQIGDRLKTGDKLLALDCRDAQLQTAIAKSAQSLASKEWRRAEKLQRSNTISEQQINQSKAAFEQASTQLKQAKVQVERCNLNAPFDGVVTARYVQLGAYLQAGMPAFKFIAPSEIEGQASLLDAQIKALKQANNLLFETAGQLYPVRYRVGQAFVDPNNRQRQIRFEFIGSTSEDAPLPLPLPGSSGWLQWQDDAAHLPANFMLQRQQQLGYFMVVNNKAVFQPLPDARLGHPARLGQAGVSSIDAQAAIVTEGRQRLNDGDSVRVQ